MPGHHNYSEDFKAGMFSTCEESITKNNTDMQSTTVHGQNVDQFSDGLNTPQSAPSEDSIGISHKIFNIKNELEEE
uniref:Uncharacterized protein n=1 Tax=Magallana gigas TaxID=29159 RepID=K1QGF5_MAGGI